MPTVRLVIALLFLSTAALHSQTVPSRSLERSEYELALELFNKGQYGAAQQKFDAFESQSFDINREERASAAYYATLCAMYLYNGDAKSRIENFVLRFPLSPLVNQLYLDFADNKFSLRQYRDAAEYYARVNAYRLNSDQLNEYRFKWAYSQLMLEELGAAKKLFLQVKDQKSIYASSARYYYAHLLYTDSNYTEALSNFLPLQEDADFGPLVPYYLAQIYYRLGDFDQLLAVGEKLVESATPSRAPEIAKLMADAFYSKKQYAEALKYYELYRDKGGKMRSADYYQLGYIYYHQKRFALAVEHFNKITGGDDFLLQNTYYHLGDAYLQQGEKNKAQTAFKAASEITASPSIREDAYFNYAKLAYELSDPYGDALTTLNAFIAAFPESKRVSEVNRYLANLYVTTKDYEKAMLALQRTGLDAPEMRAVYQKISFYRATELFNSQRYPEAIVQYKEALDYPINPTLSALSTYWKSEALYRMGQYEEALRGFVHFRGMRNASALSEFNTSYYNSGYAHLKLNNYAEAAQDLRIFTRNAEKNDSKMADAYLRMADAYLLTGGYLAAIDFYARALEYKSKSSDYALYQKAISQGLAGKPKDKVASLQKLLSSYPASVYATDAQYEMAVTELQEESFAQAIADFRAFIGKYPKSERAPGALLSIGLAYQNQGQDEMAIKTFKEVTSTYPGSEAAIEAVGLARLAYSRKNRVDEYLDWVGELEFVKFDKATLDSTAYNTAFDLYASSRCEEAIGAFQRYLQRFERGIFQLDANYYLAQCAQNQGDTAVFIQAYQRLLNLPKNPYQSKAYQVLAYQAYTEGNYSKAIDYYRGLSELPLDRDLSLRTQAGLMRSYFKLRQYDKAASYAELVRNDNNGNPDLLIEARRIGALSDFELDRLEEAQASFALLAAEVKGEAKAEALYHLALISFAQGKYEETKNTVNTLINDLPAFKDYKIKALLLLARNYWKQSDIFQANYILDFVIKSKHSPQSVEEAEDLKRQIVEAEQAAIRAKQREIERNAQPIQLGNDGSLQIIDAPVEVSDSLKTEKQPQ